MKFITPILVIIISVVIYYSFISSELGDVKALSVQKENYTNVLNEAKDVKAKRDQFINEYNNISPEDVGRLDKIMPAEFNAVSFANDINSIAAVDGLTLQGIVSGAGDNSSTVIVGAPDAFKTTAVTATLVGQYPQFVKFLTDLETSLRLVDVVDLTITSTNSGSAQKAVSDVLQYRLTLNTYSLK